jgi:DNA-binding HxlR family transcriptional regulator
MKAQILQLLGVANMTAGELRMVLKCRHETLYQTLVSMEASGLVTVWAKDRPAQTLWCKAEATA